MKPQQRGRHRGGARTDAAEGPSEMSLDGAPVEGGGAGASPIGKIPASELGATLMPLVEAVVRMAGATAATVRVIVAEGGRLEPEVAFGLPADTERAGALAFWCGRCSEARNPGAECVKSHLCGSEEHFAVDLFGPACLHIVAVPLRYRDATVGTLKLLFDAERTLPPEAMPLLRATGELIGVALENARLSRENLRVSLTNERQMMANEVHDSLAQGLTYMRMRMSLLRDAVRQGDELRAFKYWSDVDSSLTNAHRRLRELITYFRSRMDPQGLQHALGETAETFFDRTGVALDFSNRVPELHLPVGREVQVFHIVQEALANVCKHANARNARLTLERKDDGYEIAIEDDGVGMAADPGAGERGDSGHYGIAIMRERARRLGGELMMESAEGAGTRVRLRFPAVQPQSESRL